MTERGHDFVTVAEAARRMARSEEDILAMITTGFLTAMVINGIELVMWPPAHWSGQEVGENDPEMS